MARGADGTIRIDSKIDETGFNKGVKSMTKSLAPLAVAATAVFITLIGVKSVKAVASLSAEFQRLEFAAQAVGQIHGVSAEETRNYTKAIVESGIQTDIANRAYVNFTREGMDRALLPALARGAQDLNVFSAAGESSSDVLDRLIFGILNMNALMLRRAGVAIDVMEAEKEHGETIGKNISLMTVQEKRQGILIKVLEKLKSVQGLYELSQKTAAGQLASNIRIMNEFKAVLGGPLQNAFFTLIKSWNSLLKVMTAALGPGGAMRNQFIQIGAAASILADIIASLFRAFANLFGVEVSAKKSAESLEDVAGAAIDAAEGQDTLAKSTKEAGKAAKGALAPFDELNVLQKEEPAGGAAGADVAGLGGALGGIDPSAFINPMDEIAEAAKLMKIELMETFEDLVIWLENAHEWIITNKAAIIGFLAVLAIVPALMVALGFGVVPILAVVAALLLTIWVVTHLGEAWEIMQQLAFIAWFKIKEMWGKAGEWFRTKVGEPIEEGFTKAFESVKIRIKSILNSIIYFINQMIAGVVNGINSIIFAANKVSNLAGIPAIGYMSASYIPYLARGAVIQPNAPFAAVLGDQSSGRNIEAPENLIRQIVREEAGNNGPQDPTTITFAGAGADIVRMLKPEIDKEDARVGKSLLSGGVV